MKHPDRWRQIGLTVAVLVTLATVFSLYWLPDLTFDLATRIWRCF